MRANGKAFQRAEIGFHAIDIEHQARRRRLMLGNEMGDFGRHRTLPPFHKRPPVQAAGGVDETVERTSDQNDCQNA
jgi:hypothetical protein